MDITGVTHLIWDLDGTLIDSFSVYAAILQEAAALSGLAMPAEEKLLRNFHGSLDDSIKNAFDLVGGEDFDRLLNDFLRVQEKYYKHPEAHVFADALGLAQRAANAGAQQAVVTNRAHAGRGSASPRYLIKNTALKDLISGIVCGDETDYRKPDVRVLAAINNANQLNPETTLVVGDQIADAELAQNFGCRAVIVTRNVDPVPHLDRLGSNPDFLTVVYSLDEVTIA